MSVYVIAGNARVTLSLNVMQAERFAHEYAATHPGVPVHIVTADRWNSPSQRPHYVLAPLTSR